MKSELYEVVVPTDRWSVKAVSPVDIRDGIDSSTQPVIIHPGWGKGPEGHTELMDELAKDGFLPIAVDTRYGYADRQDQVQNGSLSLRRVLTQPYRTGTTNPYFPIESRADNRWEYRRPTSLLYLCEQLGIKDRTYVGHSFGGLIVTLATLGAPELTDQVIIVNGAGSGDSSKGLSRLRDTAIDRLKTVLSEGVGMAKAPYNGLDSITYSLTHLRRTLKEKEVIQSSDLWSLIDQVEPFAIPVSVFHAKKDRLISFKDSARAAEKRPWVDFQATEGDHSNVYGRAVRRLIAKSIV